MAGGVGFSVCILKDEIQHKILSYKLNTHNTVFKVELVALGEVPSWAVETNYKINILSDSGSSIHAVKDHRTKSKFVNGIKEKFRLTERFVGFAWVKAHIGIPGMSLPIASPNKQALTKK
ncbi:hypothetical protein AVEN_125911-1 [Araneus ventricosus]|uniref:RNase H type-1 domain-containing protein n=1 Tax=Araneus ventricosus TaxID=182803 RepID=A0A4Y2GMA8_ARAVE|nr:hypothetical protein AVEN_125911-1 [Araneus ventricosus]